MATWTLAVPDGFFEDDIYLKFSAGETSVSFGVEGPGIDQIVIDIEPLLRERGLELVVVDKRNLDLSGHRAYLQRYEWREQGHHWVSETVIATTQGGSALSLHCRARYQQPQGDLCRRVRERFSDRGSDGGSSSEHRTWVLGRYVLELPVQLHLDEMHVYGRDGYITVRMISGTPGRDAAMQVRDLNLPPDYPAGAPYTLALDEHEAWFVPLGGPEWGRRWLIGNVASGGTDPRPVVQITINGAERFDEPALRVLLRSLVGAGPPARH